jgi:hypothetical protein
VETLQRIGEFAAAAEAAKTGQRCPATSRDCLPAQQSGTPQTGSLGALKTCPHTCPQWKTCGLAGCAEEGP